LSVAIFWWYGTNSLIFMPTVEAEEEIVSELKNLKRKTLLEQSFDDEADEPKETDEIELQEHERNIVKAIGWKRRHFFVNCFFISIFFMIKLEFSYSTTFANNIILWQIIFTFLDIVIEQVLTRIVMGEALMTAPLLS